MAKVCPSCELTYGDDDYFCAADGAPLRSTGAEADNLVGTVIAPLAAAIGALTAVLADCTIEVEKIAPHRVFPGNRPSITILYRKLDPATLGRLIALYEHRVFVEAQLFGINAFDQWGVELGKELATGLLPVVEGKEEAAGDGSTAGLVRHIHNLRGEG